MNPGSADHAGDVKSEGAGVAGEILLVYDWECPACDAYCRLVRIQRSVGTLRLVNAREPSVVIDEITQAGLDIDQGVVVKMGGRLYYGKRCGRDLLTVAVRRGAGLLRLEAQALHSVLLVGDDFSGNR